MKILLITPLWLLFIGLSQLSAAVIYTPQSFHYAVGTGNLTGSEIYLADLPGANDVGVSAFSYSATVPASNFYQLNSLNNGAYIPADILEGLYYAHTLSVNESWDNLPGGQNGTIYGADISRMALTGSSSYLLRPTPVYVPFRFTDTTDSSTKYGYITLATTMTGSGASAQFNLDIFGYAYENSGAKISMGAVPEPSIIESATLGILGAVAVLYRRTRRVRS